MGNEFVTDDSISVMAQLPDQAVASMITDPPYPNYQGLFSDQISDGYTALYLACRKVKKYIVFFWHPRAPAPVPPRGWYEVARHIWHKPDAASNTPYEHIIVWDREGKRQRSRVWNVPILEYRTLRDWCVFL